MRRDAPVRSLVVLLALLSLARAEESRADERRACVESHEQAQVERNQGHLRAARERLRACSRATCPALVVKDCSTWLDQVDNEIPSIVVSARDAEGREVADVRVAIDGMAALARLDGEPFDVDPGQHTFVFERSDGERRQQQLLVVAGEKGRALRADFGREAVSAALAPAPVPAAVPPPAAAAGAPPPSRRIPTGAWVAAGVGTVALAAFAYYGLTALARHAEYRQSCGTQCTPAQAADVTALNRTADVSLGIAAVAAGVSLWLMLSHRPAPAATAASAARLGATPLPGGGEALLSGSF